MGWLWWEGGVQFFKVEKQAAECFVERPSGGDSGCKPQFLLSGARGAPAVATNERGGACPGAVDQ